MFVFFALVICAALGVFGGWVLRGVQEPPPPPPPPLPTRNRRRLAQLLVLARSLAPDPVTPALAAATLGGTVQANAQGLRALVREGLLMREGRDLYREAPARPVEADDAAGDAFDRYAAVHGLAARRLADAVPERRTAPPDGADGAG